MPADDLVWVEGNLDVEGTTKLIGGRLELRDTNGDDYKKPLALQAAFDPLGGRHALQAVVGTVTDNPPNRLAIGPQASDTDPTVTERVVVLGTGEVGIGTSAPTQMLTLESPEGTRLEITRTSASLPWSSSAPATPGSFVINHQAAGSTTPEADFALMRDRKKRLILGDDSTYLTSQNNGAVIFLTNFEETGQRENVRITPAGRVGIGTTTPFAALDVRGDILLGPNDDLFAASGEENLRIIRGVVAANLLTLAGDGFVPYPLAPTGYHIYFAVPFVDQPAATVSVISNDLSMRAVIQSLTTGALDLVIVNDGGPVISDFSFIVMGKR
jgi:hypothetical protein